MRGCQTDLAHAILARRRDVFVAGAVGTAALASWPKPLAASGGAVIGGEETETVDADLLAFMKT